MGIEDFPANGVDGARDKYFDCGLSVGLGPCDNIPIHCDRLQADKHMSGKIRLTKVKREWQDRLQSVLSEAPEAAAEGELSPFFKKQE